MESNISVVSVNKNARFNGGVSSMVNNVRNRVGSYSKDKLEAFKKKSLVILDRTLDAYIRFDDAVNDVMDNFADKLIDGYETLEEKMKERKSEVSVAQDVSVYDKLQPMMSEEEFRELGIDIDNSDNITELQEFKKEIMSVNFPQTKKNSGPVRRLVSKRNNSRGSFNIWTTVLVGSLFLGILVALTFIYY